MLLSPPGKVFNKVGLERMKTFVDKLLRDHQAGFRKDRSGTDQIATLRIIIEQSLEWNSISISSILRRPLTVWIEHHYGTS